MSSILKLSIILFFIGLVFIVWRIFIPVSLYENEYTFLMFSYSITCLAYIYSVQKSKFDIFYPIHIVTFLYFSLFIFTPMAFINTGMTDCHGVDVMPGCIRGTIIFWVGYLAFLLGYNSICIHRKSCSLINPIRYCSLSFLKINWILWSIGFSIQALHLVLSGKSLLYILSLGGSGDAMKVESKLGFFANFGFFMIYPWLALCFSPIKLKYKLVLSYLTFSVFFISGARFIFVIMTISFLICFCRIYKTKLKAWQLSVIFLALIAFSNFLGDSRRAIARGTAYDTEINIDRMLYVLQSNFDIYQIQYSVANAYPERRDFDYGGHIFYDTFMFCIPRFLWENKPSISDNYAGRMIRSTIGKVGVDAAMAWPNLTEYYADFGFVGVAVIMFLLGRFSKIMLTRYYSDNRLHLMAYAIFIPVLFQIITRGYTPQNFGLLLFLYFPYFYIKKRV